MLKKSFSTSKAVASPAATSLELKDSFPTSKAVASPVDASRTPGPESHSTDITTLMSLVESLNGTVMLLVDEVSQLRQEQALSMAKISELQVSALYGHLMLCMCADTG